MNLSAADQEAIVAWARRHPEIQQVYLYGSRARGDNRPDSDIDLALVMNRQPGDEDTWTTFIFWHTDYKENPDLHLAHEVHLEWYEAGAGLERVGPGVERDGILLYPEQ